MENLTQKELEYINKFIKLQEINIQKLNNYAEYSVDPQIKQLFNKASQESTDTKEKINSFLVRG